MRRLRYATWHWYEPRACRTSTLSHTHALMRSKANPSGLWRPCARCTPSRQRGSVADHALEPPVATLLAPAQSADAMRARAPPTGAGHRRSACGLRSAAPAAPEPPMPAHRTSRRAEWTGHCAGQEALRRTGSNLTGSRARQCPGGAPARWLRKQERRRRRRRQPHARRARAQRQQPAHCSPFPPTPRAPRRSCWVRGVWVRLRCWRRVVRVGALLRCSRDALGPARPSAA